MKKAFHLAGRRSQDTHYEDSPRGTEADDYKPRLILVVTILRSAPVLTSRGIRIFAAFSIDGFQALTTIVLAMLVRLNPGVHKFSECIGADVERSEDLQGFQ